MPPPAIPTIKGRGLDYNVEQAIYRLQAAIGEISDNLKAAGVDAALRQQVLLLQKQVSDLRNQQTIELADRISPTGGTGSGGGGGGGGGGTPGGGTPTVPPPTDLGSLVSSYAASHPADLANSCIKPGIGFGSNAYMVGLVAFLRGSSTRYNFNGKRGNTSDPSQDAVSYYYGVEPAVEGSHDVYVFDVISCYCGPEEGAACVPGPSANNVSGAAPGAWISTPPS